MYTSFGDQSTQMHFVLSKQEIAIASLLAYYDPKKPTVLQTDRHQIMDLGVMKLQHGKPVAYASKAPTGAHEQGYVALEKEALAVAWALEKHHHFIY